MMVSVMSFVTQLSWLWLDDMILYDENWCVKRFLQHLTELVLFLCVEKWTDLWRGELLFLINNNR